MHPAKALITSPTAAEPVSTAFDPSHRPSRSPYRYISLQQDPLVDIPLSPHTAGLPSPSRQDSSSRVRHESRTRSRPSTPAMPCHTYPSYPASLLPPPCTPQVYALNHALKNVLRRGLSYIILPRSVQLTRSRNRKPVHRQQHIQTSIQEIPLTS